MTEKKKTVGLRLFIWSMIAALTVAIDQLTKLLAQSALKPIGDLPIIRGVFHFTYVENTGAAFGMLKDHRWVFMVVSALSIILIIGYMIIARNNIDMLSGISLGLIAGGGIGNMIDRLALGYVTDFINFELIDFAVFNYADSAVCVGAGLLVLAVLLSMIREQEQKKTKTKVSEEAADDGK